ncbi:hypothetical protein BLNAU_20107 [Blattamonas nauphoetae]|uniref:Uncharacterized protein n=1 Tax=Blattamonas nauphoetae TaxID=2049346 RepID=A0ABQ9WZI0_9EUKA|nr:hypothetical protein BLNAU_20107 [Blattamonas nauphoetae]
MFQRGRHALLMASAVSLVTTRLCELMKQQVGLSLSERAEEPTGANTHLRSRAASPKEESRTARQVVGNFKDCSAFLNWDSKRFQSDSEMAVMFRSLVATVKLKPALHDSLEAKAVKLLEYMSSSAILSTDAFLNSLASNSHESSTDLVQSIGVLLSTPSQVITTATMKMIKSLIVWSSTTIRLALVTANLITQLINNLNPQSLSFAEEGNIHLCLMKTFNCSIRLAIPDGLRQLKIEDDNEQQAVHETVFKLVLAPSEKYLWHLCVNRFSIIDGDQSYAFMLLHATLLRICPYYEPTMKFVIHMPVFLTIPSCLTFFENDSSIWCFLDDMLDIQKEWNKKREESRQMWKTVHRMLRMESIEDVVEEKMRNDRNTDFGRWIVGRSIGWNNMQGMNLPE